jgi:hypothetical protein
LSAGRGLNDEPINRAGSDSLQRLFRLLQSGAQLGVLREERRVGG